MEKTLVINNASRPIHVNAQGFAECAYCLAELHPDHMRHSDTCIMCHYITEIMTVGE